MTSILVATSVDWVNITRIPRMLKMAGAEVTVIAPKNAVIASSRFVDTSYPVNGGLTETARFVEEHIRDSGRSYQIVILCDDQLFTQIGRHPCTNTSNWFAIKQDRCLLDLLLSKVTFHNYCRNENLPIAPFAICKSVSDAMRAASRFGYPIIVKNDTSIGGLGVHKVPNPESLINLVSSFNDEFIVQQAIVGQPFATEVLYDHGEPLCWVSSEQHNRGPRELGTISARRMIHVPAINDALHQLGNATKFHGIAVIDAILSTDRSQFVLCEMNPMPGPDALVDRDVTRRFAAGIRKILHGESFPENWSAPEEKHIHAFFPEAVYHALGNPRQLSRWRFAFQSLLDAPFDDPKLLIHFTTNISFEVRNSIMRNSPIRKIISRTKAKRP